MIEWPTRNDPRGTGMLPNLTRRIARRGADLYPEVAPGIEIAGAGRGREISAAVGVEAAQEITEEAGEREESASRGDDDGGLFLWVMEEAYSANEGLSVKAIS